MGTKYGKFNELQKVRTTKKHLDSIKTDPYKFGSIEDKREFTRHERAVDTTLKTLTPPPVETSDERSKLERRAKVLEGFIVHPEPSIKKPAMNTKQEQEDMPAGAVGKHIMYERAITNFNVTEEGKPVFNRDYSASDEWKDIQNQLAGDDAEYDPDVRNLERIRPDKRETMNFIDWHKMNFAPGANVTQEHWDDIFGEDGKKIPENRPKKEVAERRKCVGKKASGARCGSVPILGKPYCRHHSNQFTHADVVTDAQEVRVVEQANA